MRNLPVEIMRTIRDTHIKGKTVVYRDAFILSFYLVGINMADMLALPGGQRRISSKTISKVAYCQKGLKELMFAKNDIPNLVYSKGSDTFATSNNKNPAATELSGVLLWLLLEKLNSTWFVEMVMVNITLYQNTKVLN